MKKRIQVHIPYPMLLDSLDDVVEWGINPEVYVSEGCMGGITDWELTEINKTLSGGGLSITMHGPFLGIDAGSSDKRVREKTANVYSRALEVASSLKPLSIVLHGGYNEEEHGADVSAWAELSAKVFRRSVEDARSIDTVIAVENIYELTPGPLKALAEMVESAHFGVCLDVGHLNIYSEATMHEWLSVLSDKIKVVHIHDNHGKRDEHLAVGDGDIDFDTFFSLIRQYTKDPVFTIEPHGKDVLWHGLRAVSKFLEN